MISARLFPPSPRRSLRGIDPVKTAVLPLFLAFFSLILSACPQPDNPAAVPARPLDRIEVTHQPDKTEYIKGEALDITGLVVTAYYTDNTNEPVAVKPADISGYDATRTGQQTLTVTIGGKTAAFTVTVTAAGVDPARTLDRIEVTGQPTKTTYVKGEALDIAGLVVTAYYTDNTNEPVAVKPADISGYDAARTGQQTLTVTMGGKTAAFTVTVTGPALAGTVVITGAPVVGKTLTADTAGLNASSGLRYQWRQDGAAVGNPGAKKTYALTASDLGKKISVLVTAADYSGSVTGSEVGPVVDPPPLSGTIAIVVNGGGDPYIGKTLGVDVSALGPAAIVAAGNLYYTWYRNAQEMGWDATCLLSAADRGAEISVSVTSDVCTGSKTAAAVGPVVDMPALTGTVTITGDAWVGQTLTADTGALNASGGLHYQWKQDAAKTGADQETYTLTAADLGKTISVSVTAFDYAGSAAAGPTAAVTLPPLTGTVVIIGRLAGADITARVNNLNAQTGLHYAWKKNNAAVGTDRATYTTAAADVGAVFTVTVTADGYLGSASAGVTIIAPGSTIFDNVGNLKTWLQGQPANTAANPYEVTLNVDLSELEDNPAGNEYDALYKLFDALSGKYVSIDLSGCTGTGLAPSNPDYRPNTDKLIRITLPSTLTNIGDTVFYNVENLTHIDLPEGIVTIGIMAFTQCPALIEIDLPSTITDLGLNIFDEHLERIICRAVTPPVFGHAAYLNSFINLNALVSIRVPAGSVNNYKSAQGWSFKASIISALP